MRITSGRYGFISIILSLPDNLRAGKAVGAFTILLALWYTVRERQRFRGPSWSAAESDQATTTSESAKSVRGGAEAEGD